MQNALMQAVLKSKGNIIVVSLSLYLSFYHLLLCPRVVYFNQLSSAVRTQKLVVTPFYNFQRTFLCMCVKTIHFIPEDLPINYLKTDLS